MKIMLILQLEDYGLWERGEFAPANYLIGLIMQQTSDAVYVVYSLAEPEASSNLATDIFAKRLDRSVTDFNRGLVESNGSLDNVSIRVGRLVDISLGRGLAGEDSPRDNWILVAAKSQEEAREKVLADGWFADSKKPKRENLLPPTPHCYAVFGRGNKMRAIQIAFDRKEYEKKLKKQGEFSIQLLLAEATRELVRRKYAVVEALSEEEAISIRQAELGMTPHEPKFNLRLPWARRPQSTPKATRE